MKAWAEALRKGDVARLRQALEEEPALARKPQLVVDAGRLGNRAVLELLQSHGADLNASWRGYRALHALIQESPHAEGSAPAPQRLECLQWLLEHGADPEELGAWPPARALLVAAFTGAAEAVRILVKAGATVDGYAVCALGDVAAVRRDLESGPEFAGARDRGGMTALQCAAASRLWKADPKVAPRLLEIAVLLLEAGAQPDALTRAWSHDVDAAYFAIHAGNAPMLELLLQQGADATAALVSAAWSKDEALPELCLRHGADPARARAEGRPLLNELVRWGQVRPALWLLAHGADPGQVDGEGWSALHQAAARGNARLVEALLQAGADPELRDRGGVTPAMVALVRGRAAIVARLKQARQSPSQPAAPGRGKKRKVSKAAPRGK